MENWETCRMSGVQLNGPCSGAKCEKCGWNPEVVRRRKQQIHYYAQKKRLCLWGKQKTDTDSEQGEKVMELQALLYHILTLDLRVWLWNQHGECVFTGRRMGALEKFGHLPVKSWRIDGETFRADVHTDTQPGSLPGNLPEDPTEEDYHGE